MLTKMKGIYKGFKYITQIFVVKEREIEIGYPTDVKHVAHIGWDGPAGTGPSWMNEFKAAPDFSTSISGFAERRDANSTAVTSSRSTRDLEEVGGSQQSAGVTNVHKKTKRKRVKTTSSSPKSSSRQTRAAKSKATAYSALEKQQEEEDPVAQENHSSWTGKDSPM